MSDAWGAGSGALPPELDPRGDGGRGRRQSRTAGRAGIGAPRLAARIVAALVSTTLVVYLGVLWSNIHGIDDNSTQVPIAAFDEPHNTTDPSKPDYDYDGQDRNLLIVGNDDRAGMTKAEIRLLKTGGDEGSLSTDTMMIVHIPKDGSKATLISLPRDSYVAIPGHGMNRLNAAYSFAYRNTNGSRIAKIGAGADLLITTIQNLTGLHIDNFVQVGLVGFYRIAKAIGGIPVNMCRAVDDTVAHNLANGDNGGSGFKITKGPHTLTPVQALEFVRQRHNFPNGLGDLDRVKRQQYFLAAAFRQVASGHMLLNPSKLGDLVDAVDKSLYVGGGLKLLDLAKQLSNLSANNINGKTIPFVRFESVGDLGSVNIVDPTAVKKSVRGWVEGTTSSRSAYASAKTVDPSEVTVTVYNAGAPNGAAGTATNTLKAAGFGASVSTDEPAAHATTTIEYAKGSESQAKTLLRYVPGAKVVQSDVTGVHLVLGSDGVTARSKPTASKPSSSGSSKPKPRKAIDAGCTN